jgi:ABC-type sugar transport system permease subunit
MPRSRSSDLRGWLLVGPALLLFLVFTAYPLLAGIGWAFLEWEGPVRSWAGLKNFAALFQEPERFAAVMNTLLYIVVTVPFIVTIPAVLAIMAHGFGRLGVFMAFAFYLPGLSTAPILSLVWRWVFLPDGLVNGFIIALGGKYVPFLGDIPHAFLTCCFVIVSMNLGMNVILYLVAERNIPTCLNEMAALDGCSGWELAWYVTVPSMLPTVGLVAIMATIGMFQVFIVPQMLTGGGPLYSTTTVLLDLYRQAWSYGRIGVAAAEGVLLMLATGAVALVQARYVWRAM